MKEQQKRTTNLKKERFTKKSGFTSLKHKE